MASFLDAKQRQEFCELFLTFRDAGESRRSSYLRAKNDFISQEKSYPSYNTLLNWIRKGLPADQKEEPQKPVLNTDDSALIKNLLRRYRRRSEQDIDQLVDQLLPELLDEE